MGLGHRELVADVQIFKNSISLLIFFSCLGIFPVRISLFLEQCSRAPTDLDTLPKIPKTRPGYSVNFAPSLMQILSIIVKITNEQIDLYGQNKTKISYTLAWHEIALKKVVYDLLICLLIVLQCFTKGFLTQ